MGKSGLGDGHQLAWVTQFPFSKPNLGWATKRTENQVSHLV